MKVVPRLVAAAALTTQFAMATPYSSSASIVLHRNDVVPVVFDSTLSTNQNREGDRFSASVTDADTFPLGTHFDGHITRITPKTRRHGASMDLSFDAVVLPDGARESIDGVPIPIDEKYVSRNQEGRYVAKPSVSKDTAVGVGAIGGFILGTILHKPFEGTFAGILAGIAVAETTGNSDSVLVIDKDTKAGVLLRRDATIDLGGDAPNRLRVRIGDRDMLFSEGEAPYRIDGVEMVPIRATAEQLGLSFEQSDQFIYVEGKDHSLRFEPARSEYRFDGERQNLARPTEVHDGIVYAPVDVFREMLGQGAAVDH